MTKQEIEKIEAELEKRGYRRYVSGFRSDGSWMWCKSFGKEKDEDDCVISGWAAHFRVWDYTMFPDCADTYGIDFRAMLLGTDARIDLESNWEPIADIDTFERMGGEFHALARGIVQRAIMN